MWFNYAREKLNYYCGSVRSPILICTKRNHTAFSPKLFHMSDSGLFKTLQSVGDTRGPLRTSGLTFLWMCLTLGFGVKDKDYEWNMIMNDSNDDQDMQKQQKRWEWKWNLRIFVKHLYIYDNDDPNSENVLVGQQNHKQKTWICLQVVQPKMKMWTFTSHDKAVGAQICIQRVKHREQLKEFFDMQAVNRLTCGDGGKAEHFVVCEWMNELPLRALTRSSFFNLHTNDMTLDAERTFCMQVTRECFPSNP